MHWKCFSSCNVPISWGHAVVNNPKPPTSKQFCCIPVGMGEGSQSLCHIGRGYVFVSRLCGGGFTYRKMRKHSGPFAANMEHIQHHMVRNTVRCGFASAMFTVGGANQFVEGALSIGNGFVMSTGVGFDRALVGFIKFWHSVQLACNLLSETFAVCSPMWCYMVCSNWLIPRPGNFARRVQFVKSFGLLVDFFHGGSGIVASIRMAPCPSILSNFA